jgi:molybdate transport system substrate-binding protein
MTTEVLPDRVHRSRTTALATHPRWLVTALALSFAQVACSSNKDQPGSQVITPPADASPDAPAVLSLFAAGATQASVMALVPDFAAQNGLTINLTFGSVGSLRDQILTGASGADVAVLTPAVIAALEAMARVHAGSRSDLAQIGGGVAVRSGDSPPDISDSDKFKAALLAADEIYYADPALATAGMAFMKICATLGIADACAPPSAGKGHISAGGAQAMAAMALSTATTVIGATQISEIKANTGVQLVGEYPDSPVNLQVKTVYSAIIVEGTSNLANAQLLVQFLTSDTFKTQLATYGFEPL